MKKLIPVLILLSLTLSACGLFSPGAANTQVSDAEMSTRVAELLSTMTTPTTEVVNPPTPTPTATLPPPTATVAQPTAVIATEETETAEETEVVAGTATPAATATLNVRAGDPVLKLGTPDDFDPFDSAEKWTWPTDEDKYLSVSFKNGYMRLMGLTNIAGWRLPLLAKQTNSYVELTVNSGECEGKDSYGIIQRVPEFKSPTQGYLYEVTCDGSLRLWKWDGNFKPGGKAVNLISWKESEDIKAGANQSNRLGLKVVGSTISIYMNGVLQGEASDESYASGYAGVFVHSVNTSKFIVKFDEMKIWKNPK